MASTGVTVFLVFLFMGLFMGLAYYVYKRVQRHNEDNKYIGTGPPPNVGGTPNRMFKPTPSMGESAGPIGKIELEGSSHNSSLEHEPVHYTSTRNIKPQKKKTLTAQASERLQSFKFKNKMFNEDSREKATTVESV